MHFIRSRLGDLFVKEVYIYTCISPLDSTLYVLCLNDDASDFLKIIFNQHFIKNFKKKYVYFVQKLYSVVQNWDKIEDYNSFC